MADSISDSISTTGSVTVGSSVTGEVETPNDRDAYSVELVVGRTYRIDLEGAATGKGTLVDPLLHWLRDSSGNGLHGTRDDNGGEGLNARQEFTPQVSGTYYISARGNGGGVGTYTLTVTDTSVTVSDVNEVPSFGQQGYTFSLAENAVSRTCGWRATGWLVVLVMGLAACLVQNAAAQSPSLVLSPDFPERDRGGFRQLHGGARHAAER